MRKTVVVIILIVVVGIIVAYSLYLQNNRYYIVVGSKNLVYEVDKKTGKTWRVNSHGKKVTIHSFAGISFGYGVAA